MGSVRVCMCKGPYIYDIQEKCPILVVPPSAFFCVRMGPNWGRPPPLMDVET